MRFGIIGCGMIGKTHAAAIAGIQGAQLVAAADVLEDAARAFGIAWGCRIYTDYVEMLREEKPDIVVIGLLSGLHHQAVKAAAEAGCHVMVEKPVDISTEAAEEMIRICRERNVYLGVISQHRFDDSVMTVARAVREGKLGKLHVGLSRTLWYREASYFENPWRGTKRLDGGGALINQSIHYIDLLLYFMGPVRSVTGKCRTLLHRGIEVEDTGVAILQFESGAIGTITGTTLAYPGLQTELSLMGEEGTVTITNDKLTFCALKKGNCPGIEAVLRSGDARLQELTPVSHQRQFQDMMAAVREGRQPAVTGEDGLCALRVVRAVYESSETGREVFLS